MSAGEIFVTPAVRAGNGADLAGNLTGVLGHIKTSHHTNPGAPFEESIGDHPVRVSQGRDCPHTGDPNCRGMPHRLFSTPPSTRSSSIQPPQAKDQAPSDRSSFSKKFTSSSRRN